jgi:hypothetical protein
MTKAERETAEHFAERDRVGIAEVSRRVERAVIGGDWGANGYTTMAQADVLARELGLGPGARLLDLGAGPGSPGRRSDRGIAGRGGPRPAREARGPRRAGSGQRPRSAACSSRL